MAKERRVVAERERKRLEQQAKMEAEKAAEQLAKERAQEKEERERKEQIEKAEQEKKINEARFEAQKRARAGMYLAAQEAKMDNADKLIDEVARSCFKNALRTQTRMLTSYGHTIWEETILKAKMRVSSEDQLPGKFIWVSLISATSVPTNIGQAFEAARRQSTSKVCVLCVHCPIGLMSTVLSHPELKSLNWDAPYTLGVTTETLMRETQPLVHSVILTGASSADMIKELHRHMSEPVKGLTKVQQENLLGRWPGAPNEPGLQEPGDFGPLSFRANLATTPGLYAPDAFPVVFGIANYFVWRTDPLHKVSNSSKIDQQVWVVQDPLPNDIIKVCAEVGVPVVLFPPFDSDSQDNDIERYNAEASKCLRHTTTLFHPSVRAHFTCEQPPFVVFQLLCQITDACCAHEDLPPVCFISTHEKSKEHRLSYIERSIEEQGSACGLSVERVLLAFLFCVCPTFTHLSDWEALGPERLRKWSVYTFKGQSARDKCRTGPAWSLCRQETGMLL